MNSLLRLSWFPVYFICSEWNNSLQVLRDFLYTLTTGWICVSCHFKLMWPLRLSKMQMKQVNNVIIIFFCRSFPRGRDLSLHVRFQTEKAIKLRKLLQWNSVRSGTVQPLNVKERQIEYVAIVFRGNVVICVRTTHRLEFVTWWEMQRCKRHEQLLIWRYED